MVRRLKDGRIIFSAGEIGEYTVCPEAWRLKFLEKVETIERDEASAGIRLHDEWAKEYEAALYLSRGVRSVFLLIAIVLLTFVFSQLR